MDKLPKELGDTACQFRLYPAHVAGVPLRPGLSPSYAARGVLPASLPERPVAAPGVHRILKHHCRNRDSHHLYVHNLPPALRLWLVGYTVAIGCPLTIGSHDNGFCGSYYYECL